MKTKLVLCHLTYLRDIYGVHVCNFVTPYFCAAIQGEITTSDEKNVNLETEAINLGSNPEISDTANLAYLVDLRLNNTCLLFAS